EKRVVCGLAKLQKALRKRDLAVDARANLEAFPLAAPPEMEQLVLQELKNWSRKEKKSDLVRATLRGWWWLAFRQRLKRFVRGLAIAACIFVLVASTMKYLFEHGYFTVWLITMGSRQQLKEFPEMAKPARPWAFG